MPGADERDIGNARVGGTIIGSAETGTWCSIASPPFQSQPGWGTRRREFVMTWADFYMSCFLFGLILSGLSLLVGLFNLDIPGLGFLHHMHLHGFHLHLDHGHVHLPHAESAGGPAVSPFNFSTAMAFLAWFGG